MPKDSLKQFVSRSRTRLTVLLLLGVALIVVGLVARFWETQPRGYRLRVTGGVSGLNRYGVAEYLARHDGELGLEIEVIPTEGSSEAIQQLNNRKIDMALVNGLLRRPGSREIRQVAAITVEAVHLLVKQEFASEVAGDFSQLQGLSVSLGPAGSETELITSAVLKFCGLSISPNRPIHQLRIDRQGINELLATLNDLEQGSPARASELRNTLPDVVIHSSTLPSPLARQLIHIGEYRLIPLPFADAFSRITVKEEELDQDHIDEVHVVPATIPAFMYGAAPPVPASDVPTLGCPLILVAHDDVPNPAVARLLPHIFEGPVERVFHPPAIAKSAASYPWHAASLAYRDKDKPLVRADIARLIQQLSSVIAPLFGGCLALYGFYRWRQTLRFIEYFEQLRELDQQAKGLTDDDVVTPAEAELARRLEAQLTRLQQLAVTDFCRNYFRGEGVLQNFLQLLAETRDFLRASQQSTISNQPLPPKEPPSTADPQT